MKVNRYICYLVFMNLFGCFIFCDGNWIYFDKNYEILVENFSQAKGAICVNGKYKIDLAYDNNRPSITLHDYLRVNDTIIIEAFNDTIYVKRDNKTKWFYKYGLTSRNGEYGANDKREINNHSDDL